MNHILAVNLLNSLGNNLRLRIFKMLIQAGEEGLNPRFISDTLDIKPNKLSFHLTQLKELELINSTKTGRQINYVANYDLAQKLTGYLFENCCGKGENLTVEL